MKFASLEDVQHFIDGEQAAEYIACASVQKSALQDVAIKKPQRGTERQLSRKNAQSAARGKIFAEPCAGRIGLFSAHLNLRLPIRVAVVLFHPGINVRVGVMQHIVFQVCRRAIQQDVLMDFVVAGGRVNGLNLFGSAAKRVPERDAGFQLG